MKTNRVRANGRYIYHPNLLDSADSRTSLQSGDIVKVVNLPGCPRANTMGHCHVERDGRFAGLVHVNSLHTIEEYTAYLRNRLAAHSDNPINKAAIASPLHTL